MGDVAIRPIPDFEGYFAGDDGTVYRVLKPGLLPSGKVRDLTVSVDGKTVHRPLAWFVARAWVDGYEFGKGMRVRFVNGDTLDVRADNLEWTTSDQLEKERDKRYRERLRKRMAEDPDDPRHGTYTGYNGGCRCERCRAMGPIVNRRNNLRKTMREAGIL